MARTSRQISASAARVCDPRSIGQRIRRLYDAPRCASVANASEVSAPRVPGLDHEAAVKIGEGQLSDVDPEPILSRHCAPGNLRFTDPRTGITLGRVDRRAVQRQSRITRQTPEL